MNHRAFDDTISRTGKLRGLVTHAAAFLAVNWMHVVDSGWRWEAGHFWGWGIGLLAHAVSVLVPQFRASRFATPER